VATKSKPRGKGGAAPGAPKPRIEPRKTPLMRRRWFRITALVVLVALALWVFMFTWGRVSRAHALRTYETKLFDAGRPFFQDIEPGDSSIQQIVANFRDNKITSDTLANSAAKWEQDINASGAAIQALKPPSELKNAQSKLLAALSDYVGVVRFYTVVQKQRQLEDQIPATSKDPKTKAANLIAKKSAEDQVQLMLQHIAAARQRADTLYTSAIAEINALAAKWGVKAKTPLPAAPGDLPPAGSNGQPSTSGLTPVPS